MARENKELLCKYSEDAGVSYTTIWKNYGFQDTIDFLNTDTVNNKVQLILYDTGFWKNYEIDANDDITAKIGLVFNVDTIGIPASFWVSAVLDFMVFEIPEDIQYMVIANGNTGRLYTSLNSGTDWTERQPGGNQGYNWYLGDASESGEIMLAAIGGNAPGGKLYISSDYGINWVEHTPAGAGDKRWLCGEVSGDGLTIMAGIGAPAVAGRIYMSTDGGVTFPEILPAGDVDRMWHTVRISNDGQYVVVQSYNSAGIDGKMYKTENQGSTWTEVLRSGSSIGATGVSISSDGTGKILYTESGGRVWLSFNGGTTWTEKYPLGDYDNEWGKCCGMSHVGDVLIVGIYYLSGALSRKGLCVSRDSGATWDNILITGVMTDYTWWEAKVSRSGETILCSRSYASSDLTNLYISRNSGNIGSWVCLPTPYDDNINNGTFCLGMNKV